MGKAKPNMRTVAKVAQVSPTTVWMVIHNKPGIAPKTVQRVWATIADLDYKVKSTANSDHSKTIVLLIEQYSVPVITDVFYGEIIRGFQTEAERLGYHVVLSTFDRATGNIDVLKRRLAQKVSGVVVANDGDITPEMVIQLESLSIPTGADCGDKIHIGLGLLTTYPKLTGQAECPHRKQFTCNLFVIA